MNDNRATREQVLVNNPYVIIPIILLLLFRVHKIFALEICCFICVLPNHPHPILSGVRTLQDILFVYKRRGSEANKNVPRANK